MARPNSSTLPEEELEASNGQSAASSRRYDESPLDAHILDLEEEAESPFLRGQKRVRVRRGAVPRGAAGKIKLALALIFVVGCAGLGWMVIQQYATRSWRFRIDSSDNLAVVGNRNVTRAQVLEIMAGDVGRNIFFVPLEQRKKQLEQIPWVQSAAVMRLLPDRLRVVIQERTPVAFAQINSRIELIDASGVLMELPANSPRSYSFPIIIGMSENEPVSTRAARMKGYMQLIKQLDGGGTQYSRDLSDVDLSDLDDIKATVVDPHGAVLVHLGAANFLERFNFYQAHVQEWRAQFQKLQSVNLRYDHQVIVNPDETAATGGDSVAAAAPKPAPARKPPPLSHRKKKH
jgi:cell division protein FtsQ